MTPRRSPRGMTLIELMVTVAVSSVVISASIGVFVAMSRQMRASERRLDASSSAILANAIVQLDLGNAGYRFPVPAFAVRHYNNVDGAVSLSSVGPPITTAGECAGSNVGLVEGTDVVQVAEGFGQVGPGRLMGLLSGPPNVQIRLGTLGEPFDNSEFAGSAIGSILLLAGPDQRGCLGQVTAMNGLEPSVTLQMMTPELTPVLDPTFYPAQCPVPAAGAAQMRVYRLQRFVRYMVCGRVGGGPEERALYRQESDPFGNFAAPQVIQEGVEDLQVSLRLADPSGAIRATGTGESCMGTGASQACYCNDSVASNSCTIPVEPPGQFASDTGLVTTFDTINDPAMGIWRSRVRGARISVTSIGTRMAHDPSLGRVAMSDDLRRPESFDHPEMPVVDKDGFLRTRQTSSFILYNLGVMP